jgi:alcohol dehydrogenase class IV
MAERTGVTSIIALGSETSCDIGKGIKYMLDSKMKSLSFYKNIKLQKNTPLITLPSELTYSNLNSQFAIFHKDSKIISTYSCPNFTPMFNVLCI